MRALILCDYEGTTGTVCWEEQDKMAPEAMAGDANAVIAGLRKGGFTRFVVRDYHGRGRSINPADLDPAATLVRGGRVPFPYGLGANFDAFVFAGAHAMAGTATGVMSHTMNDDVFEMRINGVLMGEIGGFALLAGHFDVPVILVAGDEAACKEAEALLGKVETAAVKVGLTRQSAACLHPSAARELIESKALSAAQRIKEFRPFKMEGPFVLEVTYKFPEEADRAVETISGERVGDRTVRLARPSVVELLQCFERGFE